MGLFGKRKKEREKEYMNRLDVPLCLKEDFELIIDDVFTIMGVQRLIIYIRFFIRFYRLLSMMTLSEITRQIMC